ncbi:putative bifunctional diguanylate cyclase/phosphodiesterase [Franzmannia pantelleriensis]|uniref:putative bifunctional diguanylate cyclase/phosphodiesterase n=1 Tax=Franzmannia pantelleriensis TaxID=48727 RepID=UPI00159F9C18|nr:GGDEF domain-containing phosphodiesterase [Halomonas pantelleriensis]
MGHLAALPASLASLLDIPGLAISIADGERSDCPLLFVNREFERLTGYAYDEVIGRSCRMLQSHSTDPEALAAIRRALDESRPTTVTIENHRKDGTPFWNELSLAPLFSQGGRRYLIGIQRDVTEREHSQQRMKLADAVFRNTHDGILVTDADKRIIDTNPAFSELTGYRQDEVLGKKPNLLSSGKHDSGFYQSMFAAVEERGFWTGDIWNTRKDGSQLIENTTISAIRDESGEIVNYIGVFRDITQRRLNQARLERMASYDPLTGLFNREHFNTLLERQLASLEFTQSGLAVLFLDLDDFKPINDTYGHASGDELLVEISRRLKRLMRANDLTARFGGDEFVIALGGLGTQSKAGKVAEKVLADLTQTFELDNGQRVEISASIGIAFTSDHQLSCSALLDAADAAMYDAKQLGKNRIAFAANVGSQGATQDAYSRVKAAFESGEIVLHFQPILDLRSHEVVGFEALARWHHPIKGVLGPEHFIDVITQSSLSLPFGRWLIDQAGRVARHFRNAGHRVMIAVNLSQDQIETGAFIEALSTARAKYALDDPFLVAEVLESTQFHDMELASNLLQEARGLGAKIALDDFGTGISSITYASQLPLNTIKIDRMATRHVEVRQDRQQFISGIIHMGHAMQRRVLAEGIETQTQLETLTAMGCDLGQGFHIGKPMAEAALFARYLADGPPHGFLLKH